MTNDAPVRRRDAAATRAAILMSARRAFAARGYDGAGVRDIAEQAGVTAMLVNRYFGSKEALFTEAVAVTFADPQILRDDVLASPTRAHDLAEVLIAETTGDGLRLEGFLILLRSSGNPRAVAICREQIERHQQRRLASTVDATDAAERAAVALSLIAGFQFMRQMVGLGALDASSPDRLAAVLTPALAALLDA
ncbi:transcriptional regulator, TetR family [Luteibacter sp. UNCMF331Sha3.1]|uniref:TetR/AcrR family transcriptional regulator n=1 Tax=Luteibacter sp. UNCMF331Sha3.1 TaxID=1502760 RepID=UPI0008BA06AF|nr:TetR/AcrR family transcriptional regulator [Luteibacter sp. UNCMF331Sha3.1]SEM19396.1 transcriptional regulator, TetR family [Luteibacter sp. UNCMF331Sha3.1]